MRTPEQERNMVNFVRKLNQGFELPMLGRMHYRMQHKLIRELFTPEERNQIRALLRNFIFLLPDVFIVTVVNNEEGS